MHNELVLDLHIHSRFSRAVSQKMNIPNMYIWGRKKGINILSVTDFTHPIWFKEIYNVLEPVNEGVYRLRNEDHIKNSNPEFFNSSFIGPYFLLSTEISNIYSENGQHHRIHNLIFAPSLEVASKINQKFKKLGFNLTSDGRPTLGISVKNLAEVLFEIDRKIAIVPCHVWTPWFSLYGSKSGYDSIVDCFGSYAKYIFAVESGLSSDPAMNWRIRELTTRSIVSFSDAHSMQKMGREATVLRLMNGIAKNEIALEDITYSNILNALVRGKERIFEIGYTIEFYPEEGKYHYTGHRKCDVIYSPQKTKELGTFCPVCQRGLTVGVMHRVEELSNSSENNFTYTIDQHGVAWVRDPQNKRPGFVSLVPLLEILSEAMQSGIYTAKVMSLYDKLIEVLGSEHEILLRSDLQRVRELAGSRTAEGVRKVRKREIVIHPGFDGEYGVVNIWPEKSEPEKKTQKGLEF